LGATERKASSPVFPRKAWEQDKDIIESLGFKVRDELASGMFQVIK